MKHCALHMLFYFSLIICMRMNFPIQINTPELGLSILYFKESQFKICKSRSTSVPKDCFSLENSADPDEICFAAYHLGPCCMLKYPFRVFQNTKN